MSFFKEIAEKFGWEREDYCPDHKVTVFGTDCVLVEGHKGIYLYEENEAGFRLKRGRVCIRGSGLVIREINRDEAFVKGTIEEIVYG